MTSDTLENEYRVRHRDGRLITVAEYVLLQRDAAGDIVRLIGQTHDITKRKRAEERQVFLLRLSDALRPVDDTIKVQAIAARILGEHLGASRVVYATIEASGEYGVIAQEYHADAAASSLRRYQLDPFGTALLQRQRAGERTGWARLGVRSLVASPLVKGEHMVAVFLVAQATPRAWTEDEVALVEETAERTWAALELFGRCAACRAKRLDNENDVRA